MARFRRKIVKIDESKCTGCGLCVPTCAEQAIRIVDGKARLISENYCDGLGACLGKCPEDAITIEERVADEFDEEMAVHHAKESRGTPDTSCASVTISQLGTSVDETPPALSHWPVQLSLVPADAPFLRGADVVLAAECVPFAYTGFHRDFLKDKALLIACPKLQDFQEQQAKLVDIMKHADIKSLTVLHMEVPCCSGLVYMARQAARLSGKDIPLTEITLSVKGTIVPEPTR